DDRRPREPHGEQELHSRAGRQGVEVVIGSVPKVACLERAVVGDEERITRMREVPETLARRGDDLGLALGAMLLGDVVDQEASGFREHRLVIGLAQRVARRVDGLMRALERAVAARELQARLQIREALAIRIQRARRELELAAQPLEPRLVVAFDERGEIVVARDAAASFLLERRRPKQLLAQRAVLVETRAAL